MPCRQFRANDHQTRWQWTRRCNSEPCEGLVSVPDGADASDQRLLTDQCCWVRNDACPSLSPASRLYREGIAQLLNTHGEFTVIGKVGGTRRAGTDRRDRAGRRARRHGDPDLGDTAAAFAARSPHSSRGHRHHRIRFGMLACAEMGMSGYVTLASSIEGCRGAAGRGRRRVDLFAADGWHPDTACRGARGRPPA